MCQGVVLDFLRDNPDSWFTVREISVATGLSVPACSDNCRMLRKSRSVLFRSRVLPVGRIFKPVIVYRWRRL